MIPSYVINLDKRTDRWELWKDQPVERWSAWDGMDQPPPEWFIPNHVRRRGAWGCFMSHYLLWQKIVASKEPFTLILEDDCVLDEDFWERFYEFTPPENWEMWYPGGNIRWQRWVDGRFRSESGPKLVRDGVLKVFCVDRTHAYCITRACAIRLANLAKHHLDQAKYIHHVDWWLSQWLHGRETTYAPTRWMCGQKSFYSDICDFVVSDNRWDLGGWRFRPGLISMNQEAAEWLRTFPCYEGPWDATKVYEIVRKSEGPVSVITPDVKKAYDWFVNPIKVEKYKCPRAIKIIERGVTV